MIISSFQTYIFVAEVPTCLRILKVMTETELIDFTEEDHLNELRKFIDELKYVASLTAKMPEVCFIEYGTCLHVVLYSIWPICI